MGKGARFWKCDLHMHTPADPVGWDGAKMGQSVEDHKEQASEYIKACYDEGLEVIAITDHNFASKEYIRILREEVKSVAWIHGYSIVIFSGFEIQANIGKGMHVLAIFDPTTSAETVDHIMTQCGIDVPRFNGRIPVRSSKNLESILETVQERKESRDEGIVIIPHSRSKKGVFDNTSTEEWLQAEQYTQPSLLCVEVSKPIESMSDGWKHMLINGEKCDKRWQRKRPLACIMSSDAKRYGDKSMQHNIGHRYTWIKMSEPTIEGLRQAFLAHESRIRLSDPMVPSVYIDKVKVSSCQFFGPKPVEIAFNRQFNAIIGGRGSGKSTILEYIRWALHAKQAHDDEGLEGGHGKRNIGAFITETLSAHESDASVSVTIIVNDTPHIVTRRVSDGRTEVIIGQSNYEKMDPSDLQRLFPVQAYSQGQLSVVAGRIGELRSMIESPFRDALDKNRGDIVSLSEKIREYYRRRSIYRSASQQKQALEAACASKIAQRDTLQKQVVGISPEDQATIDAQKDYREEFEGVSSLRTSVSEMAGLLDSYVSEFENYPIYTHSNAMSPQATKMAEMQASVFEIRSKIVSIIHDAINEVGVIRERTSAVYSQWKCGYDEYGKRLSDTIGRAFEYKKQLDDIKRLDIEISGLHKRINDHTLRMIEVSCDSKQEDVYRQEWRHLHKVRGDMMENACDALTTASNGSIRAELHRGADVSVAIERLEDCLKRRGIRSDWIDKLEDRVRSSPDPMEMWDAVLSELRVLAECSPDDAMPNTFPFCKLLSDVGFTVSALARIAEGLDMNQWIELYLISLEDDPRFWFQISTNDEIPFEKASPGQQATALLTVLLNQDGGPLLIDQPEDDLDNSTVSHVISSMWSAKERRQLIFASHNANLVVNGDAELVIHCDYASTGSMSCGVIKNSGCIEEPSVREAIKQVMEGGEKAFELRTQKYGI